MKTVTLYINARNPEWNDREGLKDEFTKMAAEALEACCGADKEGYSIASYEGSKRMDELGYVVGPRDVVLRCEELVWKAWIKVKFRDRKTYENDDIGLRWEFKTNPGTI